jgi:hypothetical protein
MNIKLSFVAGQAITPDRIIETKTQLSKEYSKIVEDLDAHYNLHNELNATWNKFIASPEFNIVEDSGNFNIKSISDGLTIASTENKEVAENMIELMNLAFREGAKQIIQIVEKI